MTYPGNNFELDFEFILYNHLKVLSDFLAQGKADLESMILVYEQYALSQLTRNEREVLRTFKKGMSVLKANIQSHYSREIRGVNDLAKKADVLNERDELLDEADKIELKFLLRWLVSCTRKKFKASQSEPYSAKEFFTDLLIELKDAGLKEFGVEIFEREVENDRVREVQDY